MTNRITARNLARVTLIAGTLLAPWCAPVFAAEQDTAPAEIVKYKDLNLATRQGAETLYRRITAAAYMVCWPQYHGGLKGDADLHACIRDATAKAVAKVDNPMLTAIHDHTPLPTALAAPDSARHRPLQE